MLTKLTYEKVEEIVTGFNFKLLNFYNKLYTIDFIDSEGYKYHSFIGNLKRAMKSERGCAYFRFRITNPYIIDNIKLWLVINEKPFTLISNKFLGVFERLIFHCNNPECNKDFDAVWHCILEEGSGCPYCGEYSPKLSDKNRLSLLYPVLVDEWDYSKNDKLPEEYSFGSGEKVWWICSKGHSWIATIGKRTTGGKGCPTCNESHGEKKIRIYLERHNISFTRSMRLKDCKNKRPLPFDFGIQTEVGFILIEYDGQQHFKATNFVGIEKINLQKNLEYTQRNDSIKNQYCKDNNIPLYRIPYTEYDNIESILDKILSENNIYPS